MSLEARLIPAEPRRRGGKVSYADCGLELLEIMPGNWKERPGAFFQDVLLLGKM